MRNVKTIAAALALSVGALAVATPAQADRYWRHRHHDGGGAAAAGIIGFGAGAILGSALSQPRYYGPGYYEPAPIYVEPAPVYVRPSPVTYSYQPWTPDWYDYCGGRYRSFNPRTGYFVGYDGQQHFCR